MNLQSYTLLGWISFVLMTASVFAQTAPNVANTTYETIIGNATIAPEPYGRGTYGILLSSTATFGFCVWTAVHPNIIPGVSNWYRVFYKGILMVVSIIVPEGIIICAFGQQRSSRKLYNAWMKSEHIPKEGKSAFNMQVAFFVVMGGFIVEQPPEESNIETEPETKSTTPKCLRLCRSTKEPIRPYTTTLTPAGFLWCLEKGYIHEKTFDQSSIADKGKASIVAKLLAIGQTLWFLTQCVSRGASHLPLTLLEVHVAIQVIGTTIIYACWWHKLLDANEPITITLQTRDKSLLWTPIPNQPARDTEIEKSRKYDRSLHFITKTSPPNLISVTAKACYDIILYIDSDADTDPGADNGGVTNTNTETGTDEDRVTNSGEATNLDINMDVEKGPRMVADTGVGPQREKKAAWVGMFFEGLLVFLIGALHAAAWNSHFPTFVEGVLWKISCIGMWIIPTVVVLIATCTGYQKKLIAVIWEIHHEKRRLFHFIVSALKQVHLVAMGYAEKNRLWLLWYLIHYTTIWFCFLCLAIYAFCVLYITVESYISIRSPPHGAFLTPKWSSYFPHL